MVVEGWDEQVKVGVCGGAERSAPCVPYCPAAKPRRQRTPLPACGSSVVCTGWCAGRCAARPACIYVTRGIDDSAHRVCMRTCVCASTAARPPPTVQ
ncbi:hypothetical protein EON67_12210 [archaeon]|nr:MAG: hypothetical protein EON67_12210 [archaeon]